MANPVVSITPPQNLTGISLPAGTVAVDVLYSVAATKGQQYGILASTSWFTNIGQNNQSANGCTLTFTVPAPTTALLNIESVISSTTILVVNPPGPPQIPTGTQAIIADTFVESMGLSVKIRNRYQANDSAGITAVTNGINSVGVRYIRDGGNTTSCFTGLASQTWKLIWIVDPLGGFSTVSNITSQMQALADAGKIYALELINEPDLQWSGGPGGGSETYLGQTWSQGVFTYANAVIGQVKGVGGSWNSVKFLSPPLALSRGQSSTISSLNAGGTFTNIDVIAMHNYQGGTNLPNDQLVPNVPTSSSRNWTGAMQSINGLAGKALISTECGYQCAAGGATGASGLSAEAQAKYVLRLYFEQFYAQYAYAPLQILKTFPYNLATVDSPTYSIMDTSGNLRQAAIAIKNTIALLGDPGASFTPGILPYKLTGLPAMTTGGGGGRSLLMQKSDGSFYLVLWTNDASWTGSADLDYSYALTLSFGGLVVSQVNLFQPTLAASNTATQTWNSTSSITTTVKLDQIAIFQILLTGGGGGGGGGGNIPNLVYATFSTGTFGALTDATNRGAAVVAVDATAPGGYGYSVKCVFPPSNSDISEQVNMVLSSSLALGYTRFKFKQATGTTANNYVDHVSAGIIKVCRFRQAGYNNFLGTFYINNNAFTWLWENGSASNHYCSGPTPNSLIGNWTDIQIFNDCSTTTLHVQIWINGSLVLDTTESATVFNQKFGIVSPGGDVNAGENDGTPSPGVTQYFGAMGVSTAMITSL